MPVSVLTLHAGLLCLENSWVYASDLYARFQYLLSLSFPASRNSMYPVAKNQGMVHSSSIEALVPPSPAITKLVLLRVCWCEVHWFPFPVPLIRQVSIGTALQYVAPPESSFQFFLNAHASWALCLSPFCNGRGGARVSCVVRTA